MSYSRVFIMGLFLCFQIMGQSQLSSQTPYIKPVIQMPPVKNVLAQLSDGPETTKGIPSIEQSTNTVFARVRYVLEPNKRSLEVYVSKDLKSFSLGPSNLTCITAANLSGIDAVISRGEYSVVAGKPTYVISRSDGTWFVFVCPDEVFDRCAFFKTFLEDYAFFEIRMPQAKPSDLLPAIVAKYS